MTAMNCYVSAGGGGEAGGEQPLILCFIKATTTPPKQRERETWVATSYVRIPSLPWVRTLALWDLFAEDTEPLMRMCLV